MADVTDDFGRTKNIDNANFEKLASMLKSAVKTTTDFISKSKESSNSLEKSLQKMEKVLEDLGENIKRNVDSTKKFVEEIKKTVNDFEKKKTTSKSKQDDISDIRKLQSEQSKILSMILKNQQKAKSEKLALYTSGASALSKPIKNMADIGFKTKGPDKYPAMLSKNEFVVNEKAARKHGPLLNRLNNGQSFRGYRLGGKVRPKYLKEGSGDVGDIDPTIFGTIYKLARRKILGPEIVMPDTTKAQGEYNKLGKQLAEHLEKGFRNETKESFARWMVGTSTMLLGGQADFFQSIFGGSVTDATEFRKEMRAIAFQTQGITSEFREMQKSFASLGKSAVGETGKSLDALQLSYLNNLKKGFKSQKEGLKVVKSGLFLSTMIGSETQETANLFADWYRMLHLSSNEMAKMSRDMRSVARSTGVTGDELLTVMKSSEGILKNLKNQGNLTSDVSKSVIEMMAEAKKTGFEESTSKVLTALSSTSGILGADSATSGLIYTIANSMGGSATQQVQAGTFMKDQSNLAGFSDGLLRLTSNLSDGAIKTIDDFDKLSDGEKQLLTYRLRNYGLEIAEAKNLIETTKKASMGLAGKLKDVDKMLSAKFSTAEEKKLAQKQKDELYMGSAMDYLSAIREKSSGDEGLSSVMKSIANNPDFKNRINDLSAMADALSSAERRQFGLGGSQEQMQSQILNLGDEQKAQMSALIASKQLIKAAKEQGKSAKDFGPELQDAIKKGDNAKFNQVFEEMQAESSKLAVELESNTDPAKALVLTMNKLNETIRGYMSSFIGRAIDLVGAIGMLAIQIGFMTASMYNIFGAKFLEGISSIAGIKSLFGKGQGKLESLATKGSGNSALDKAIANAKKSRGEVIDIGKNKNILDITSDLGNKWKQNIIDSFTNIGNKGQQAMNRIADYFSSANFTKKIAWANRKIRQARNGIALISDFLITKFIKNFSIVKDFMHRSIFNIFNKIRGFRFTDGIDRVMKGLKRLGNVISSGSFSALDNIGTGFGRLFNYIRNFKLSNIKDMFFGLKTLTTSGLRGIGTGFKAGMLGLAKGAKAALIGGTAGFAQIIFSVIDGVFGAFSGFSNTAKNFEEALSEMGGSAKDLTWGMYASSTVAGGLVGILDGLTFGLLRITGVAGWLEKTLSLVLYGAFAIIEGAIEGLVGGLSHVGSAFVYIKKQFANIGNSLLKIFNSFAGIFGAEAKSIGEAFGMLYPYLKMIGKAIGWIVGISFGSVLWMVVKAISAVIAVVEVMAGVISGTINVIMSFVKAIGMILTGDFSGALRVVGESIWNAVAGIFYPIGSFIWSLGADIIAPFKWLYDILVGHSIIPDLCVAIVGFFGKMALNVLSGLGSLVLKVTKFFLKLPFKLMKGMFNFFVKWPLKLLGKMINLLTGGLLSKGLSTLSSKVGEFFTLFKKNMWDFSKIAFNSWYKLLNFISGGWLSKAMSVFGSLLNLIKNGAQWVGNKVGGGVKLATEGAKWAGKKVVDGAKWAGGKVVDGAKWLGSKLWPKNTPVTGGGGAWSVPPETAKASASSADDLAKSAPKALGVLGKTSKFMSGLAKKLPVIGPLLDFGIRKKVLGQSTSKAGVGAAGGLAGAAIGTALAGPIGTFVGAWAGGWIADMAYDYLAPAFGSIGGVVSSMGSMIYDGASWVGSSVSSLATNLWDGAKSIASSAWDGAKSIASSAWEGAKTMADVATAPIRVGANAALEGAKWIGETAMSGAKWIGSWFGFGDNKMEKLADSTNLGLQNTTTATSTPVGAHAIPTVKVSDENVASVQPVHLRDITESILKEKASSQAGTNKIQSDELTRMEEVANQQVNELTMIREGIQSMIDLLKPKGTVVGDGGAQFEYGTKDPRRPMHSAQFGKMKYGKVGGNANRALVNNGEV